MARLEHNTMNSMADINLSYNEDYAKKWIGGLFRKLDTFFIQRGVILVLIGFLLGRALILSQLAPFAIPFFASVYLLQKNKAPYALVGLIAGAATLHVTNAAIIFAASIIFMMLYKIREPSIAQQYKIVPAYVFLSFGLTSFAMHYLVERKLLLYDGLMMGVEAGLAFILTLIFLQCIPLIFAPKRSRTLRTEEVVSLTILIASILTGTIGWSLYDLSFEHILSRYLVLIFALSAGAAIGSTVGVVTGLIFSLASVATLFQMSLLAFAGLLGGLLKEGRKIGTAAGLLVATVLIGLYGEGTANLSIAMYESLVAIGLFLLTPAVLLEKISKFIPGTTEFSNEQQKYMRKVRDVTSHRVAQFSNVFKALSDSFTQIDEWNKEVDEEKEFDYFLSNITGKTCQSCHKKDRCWVQNFHTTYEGMKELAAELSYNDRVVSTQTEREWKYCHRFPRVVDAISQELTFYQADQKLKKQVKESRKLVAEQLRGVSEVMDEFAKEIQKERKNHHMQEEQILEAITDFGLQLHSVEIYNLEKGSIDIDISLPYFKGGGECEKLIAPMLSDILGETIVVALEDIESQPGMCFANFRSTQKFVVTTGVAHAAKGGGLISGDSYSLMELGAGKYAMAISDGMGNGERAKMESSETLELLQKILLSGIDEKVAIKSINSILSLRTTDEIFSTLDLALIDLHDAKAKFLKVCSTPSFIKRGDRVFKIESSNLPIGFLDGVDVEVVSEQLKAEDLLIMMSDGILEGAKNVENVEFWMKRKIKDLKTDKPQEVADLILEEVIRTRGDISDDMTVVVAKIKHNTPRWSAIPVSSFRKKAQ
ncbi:stage II sporulation protein E [Bacillus sp. AGMB 02131]|uniref:Stage II sporulation protein E n=1 Tax=Peribacillus faecalis TaxID=2772559 RepID=A0A927HAR9_9BACI|nr:stage II sporulation protein E [Peribacillus faecalis]MBD3108980.1 stage II sporulation protein E [Peribacillus faecalis]